MEPKSECQLIAGRVVLFGSSRSDVSAGRVCSRSSALTVGGISVLAVALSESRCHSDGKS
jgi:hypothetical protein